MYDKVRKIKDDYIRSHLTKLQTYAIKRGTLYGASIFIKPFGLCGTQIYADRKPCRERFIQGILNCED